MKWKENDFVLMVGVNKTKKSGVFLFSVSSINSHLSVLLQVLENVCRTVLTSLVSVFICKIAQAQSDSLKSIPENSIQNIAIVS